MTDIRNKSMLPLNEARSPRSEKFENKSVDSNFSSTFASAQVKAQQLSSNTLVSKASTPSPAIATLPIHSALAQNAKIQNAAASLTGTEPSLHERALALRAYRQEILASNIANADTPNYKAVDIDIKEALEKKIPLSQVPVKYQTGGSYGIDGNTVDMDVERQKFAENALMYEFEVDKVKGKYKSMSDLLQNLPY